MIAATAWFALTGTQDKPSSDSPEEVAALALAGAEEQVRELRARRETLATELVELRMAYAIADLNPDKDVALPSLPEVVAILRREELRLDAIRERLQGLRPEEVAAVARNHSALFDDWFGHLAGLGRSAARLGTEEAALADAGLGAGHPSRRSLAAKWAVIENQIAFYAPLALRILDEAQADARRKREVVEAQVSLAPPDAAVVARYRETKRQLIATEADLARAVRSRETLAATLVFNR